MFVFKLHVIHFLIGSPCTSW